MNVLTVNIAETKGLVDGLSQTTLLGKDLAYLPSCSRRTCENIPY